MASLFAGTPQTAPSYAATTSDVPKWLQDYTVDLFSQQRAVSATPYQPYALPRIAQTTAPTTAAQNLITSSSGAYQPAVGGAISGTQGLTGQQAGTSAGLGYLQQAAGMSGINAAQPYLNAAGQTATTNIGQYMNPYTQNVTDQIATLGARNLSENLLPAVSDQFIRAGQFGSSGMGTFGGRALRDTQEAILNQQNQALQAGYSQALGASQADLARQGTLASTAGQLTQAGQQNLGTIGTQTAATAQAEAQRQAAAQQQVADLAKMQQGLTTADAAALESVGTAQQQQAQRGLDVAYQDYQNQINYPQTQINNMSTTLRGLPPTAVPTTGTQTGYTTTFAPSPLSGIAAAYGTYKGLTTAAKGGLIQGYADGGAVTADPSAQELSDLEKSVMADYGQYHYKTIDLPNKLVNPTAMPNWAKVIARRPNAEAQRAKQLAILSSHLPAGVKMVGNQLQIDDTYSKYSLDNPAQLYNSVRQYANQQNNLDLYNAKLAKEGKPAVTEIPKRLGLNPMAAQSRNINFGIPNFNVLADPFSDSARIRSNINLGNVGMGGLGLGMRMNAKKPYTPLIANEGTRSMDDALQQYLNKGGNNMSLDALKQQIALGKAPAPTIDPQELYSAPNVPAAPDMSSQLADLNAKYYSQPVTMSHGGRVPGYAEGDLIDTENPADLVDGGQAFADQYAQGQQEYPTQQDVPMQAPSLSSYTQDPEVLAANAERKALLKQLQQSLINTPASTDYGPSESEKWFKLAAAYADPGKTGSFLEGTGHAASAMAEHKAELRKAKAINAAADLQRLQARSELAQKQYEMTMDEGKRRMIEKYLTPTARSTESATAGGYNTGIPDNMKALLLSQDPADAVKTLVDMAKEQNKPSDLIRGVKFLVGNGSISPAQGDAIVQENLQGKLEMVDVPIPELGGTFKLTGQEARKFYDTNTLPARLAPTQAAAPSGTPAQVAPKQAPLSQEQIEAKKTGLVEQSKKDIEASDTLLSQKSFAKQQKDAANLIFGYAKTSPNSFGVIADPTFKNAVANLVETGVNTPWGSVGLAVEEPIAKLKLTGPEATVRQMAAAPIALIEVGYRKMYLKGEGAVSNMEGALTKYIGPQLSDNAKTVQLKAGMITIGAEKQEKIIDTFERYKEQHPEAGPRSFYQTPEYKRIVDNYENKYRVFAEKNGIPIGESSTKRSSGSLADRIREERKNSQNNEGR